MNVLTPRLVLGLFSALTSHAAFAQSSAAPAGIPVAITKPQRADVPVLLSGLGLVSAANTVVLHPRVDGTLDRVNFTEGDIVKAGDALYRIQSRSAHSLERAAAMALDCNGYTLSD